MKGIVMRWHLVAQAVRRPYNIVVKRNQKKIRQLITSCGMDDACLVQSCFNRRCLRSSSQLMFPEVGRVATTELRKFVKETRASMVVATRGIDILMSMVNAKKPILTVRTAQCRVSRNASRTCNPLVCATESLYDLSLLLVLLFECCNLAKAHREDDRRPHIRIKDGSPFPAGFPSHASALFWPRIRAIKRSKDVQRHMTFRRWIAMSWHVHFRLAGAWPDSINRAGDEFIIYLRANKAWPLKSDIASNRLEGQKCSLQWQRLQSHGFQWEMCRRWTRWKRGAEQEEIVRRRRTARRTGMESGGDGEYRTQHAWPFKIRQMYTVQISTVYSIHVMRL